MEIKNLFSLKGKVAILTGGATGYGYQCLRALAESGAITYIASRNIKKLEETAKSFQERNYDVRPVQFDQGNFESIHNLVNKVITETGRIDILVNDAVARVMPNGWDGNSEEFDNSLHINGTGLFVLTKEVGKYMIDQKEGSIINISSMMGMVGVENHNYDGTDMSSWPADYFYHKGGMINFTRFCASYFGRYNVRVNTVSPGGLENNQPEQFLKNYSNRTQLGRLAGPEDLIGAIIYFASNASKYVTGTNLPVDGGYTAK